MLSAVYIKGFKTFARPVRMPLEGGVTAIVGPNGSGKSNITDAVLFALGEQSPGLLRAGAMGDVIFSGSESLKATNVAEVTLVFDNSSGEISLPYEEVSLTRRVARDGGTEYRINGSRARLSDIRAVSGEAGLGRHSILRQGAVDAIVSGGAEACRNAVEEAAGLGVYRRRRLSASRRLEKADAQLEQSRNIEAELAGQLARIEREAVQAREYREVESEYRRVSLAYLYGVASRGLGGVEEKLLAARAEVRDLESRRQELQREASALGETLKSSEGGLRASEALIEGLESSLERLRTGSLAAERNVFRLEARSAAGERLRVAGRLEDESERVRGELQGLRGRYEVVERDHARKKEERDALDRAATEARKKLSRVDQERSRASSRLEGLEARLEALGDPSEGSSLSEDDLSEISARVQTLDETTTTSEDAALRVRETGASVVGGVSEAEAGVNRRRGKVSSVVGRVEARVRDLRDTSERGGSLRLYEVLRARPGYEFAVEAALGEFGGGLFVDDVDSGVEMLSETERVAIRLDARNIEERGDDPPGAPLGVPLLDCVEVLDERFTTTVESLLGGIFVVEDAASNRLTNGHVAVTREGIRLTRTSVSLARAGRFARETRLAEALDLLSDLRDGPESYLDDTKTKLAAVTERGESVRDSGRRLTSLSARVERAREAVLRESRRRVEAIARSRSRAEERESQRSELERTLSTAKTTLRELSRRADDARRERVEASSARDRAFSSFDEVSRARRGLLSAISEGARRIDGISTRLERLRKEPSDDRDRLRDLASRASAAAGALAETSNDRRAKARLRRAEESERYRHESSLQNDLMRREASLGIELATASGQVERLEEAHRNITDSATEAEAEIQEEWAATLDDARREAETREIQRSDLEKERTRLARRLKRFGDINLLALAQEAEIKARHDLISTQRADAEKASNELNRIIQSVDGEIEARFARTFGRVRDLFGEMVPRMLSGSSGSLELTEEGVEVGLRLGRRGWRSLKVLSGGERSLLALSFLFSILLSRTEGRGTFCILDEAEAALDDINLARFISVIDSHRAEGQFLLVTHQKRTMAAADILYGVVQDASGATTVVSKRI